MISTLLATLISVSVPAKAACGPPESCRRPRPAPGEVSEWIAREISGKRYCLRHDKTTAPVTSLHFKHSGVVEEMTSEHDSCVISYWSPNDYGNIVIKDFDQCLNRERARETGRARWYTFESGGYISGSYMDSAGKHHRQVWTANSCK